MEASTAYALVLSSDLSKIKWGSNGSNTNEPTTANGFAYITFVQSLNTGTNWTTSSAVNNAFSIEVIPEPSTYALLVLAVVGLGAQWWRRGRKVA